MITICPLCNNELEVSDDIVDGQHIRCPYCDRKFSYAVKEDVGFPIRCPKCGKECSAETEPMVGQYLCCPFCYEKFSYNRNEISKDRPSRIELPPHTHEKPHLGIIRPQSSTKNLGAESYGIPPKEEDAAQKMASSMPSNKQTAFQVAFSFCKDQLNRRPFAIGGTLLLMISVAVIVSVVPFCDKSRKIVKETIPATPKQEYTEQVKYAPARPDKKHSEEIVVREKVSKPRIRYSENKDRQVQPRKNQSEISAAQKEKPREMLKTETKEHLEKKPEAVVEDPTKIGLFQGLRLGSVDDTIPDFDAHEPSAYVKKVRIKEPFGIFTNAMMLLAYTPVGKKLAGIAIVQKDELDKVETDNFCKQMVKTIYGQRATGFPIKPRFRNDGHKEVTFDELGMNGVPYLLVGENLISMTHNNEDGVSKFFWINTKLVAEIDVETLEAQTKAIKKSFATSRKVLDSFCGAKFGSKIGGRIIGMSFVKNDPESGNQVGRSYCKSLEYKKFRTFESWGAAFVSYTSHSLFRIELRTIGGSEKDEPAKVLSMLEKRYGVKPYRLHPKSNYRFRTSPDEYLLPFSNAEIHFTRDKTSMLHMEVTNFKWADVALREYNKYRGAKVGEGYAVLTMKGGAKDKEARKLRYAARTIDHLLGFTFGQRADFKKGSDYHSDIKCCDKWNVNVKQAYRGMDRYTCKVYTTPKSELICALGFSLSHPPEFTAAEEAENINLQLGKYLGVKSQYAEDGAVKTWTYTCGDSVVKLLLQGDGLGLEARCLPLINLAQKEAKSVKDAEDASLPGGEAL